jgi:hypothetical protein
VRVGIVEMKKDAMRNDAKYERAAPALCVITQLMKMVKPFVRLAFCESNIAGSSAGWRNLVLH